MPYKDYATHLRKARERYWSDPEFRERKRIIARRNHNPERLHATHIRRLYGIPIGGYEELLKQQNGGCAICGNPPNGTQRTKYLHVDHCHISNKVRGLLCGSCNSRLGWYEKHKQDLEEYLK